MIWASFSEFAVEAGESKSAAQCAMIYLGPFMAAKGLAFAVVPGGYNSWPSRQIVENLVHWGFILLFASHCLITLSRRNKREFCFWTSIQILFLMASITAVLYYWHWDALHMHG